LFQALRIQSPHIEEADIEVPAYKLNNKRISDKCIDEKTTGQYSRDWEKESTKNYQLK
jgi:hypothetical protein